VLKLDQSLFKLQKLWPLVLFKDPQMMPIKSFRNCGSIYRCLPSLQNQCVPKNLILVSRKNTAIKLEFSFTLYSFAMSTPTVKATFSSIYVCTYVSSCFLLWSSSNWWCIGVCRLNQEGQCQGNL
jgi:hypothetical protein